MLLFIYIKFQCCQANNLKFPPLTVFFNVQIPCYQQICKIDILTTVMIKVKVYRMLCHVTWYNGRRWLSDPPVAGTTLLKKVGDYFSGDMA
jgi:hypothetical protein